MFVVCSAKSNKCCKSPRLTLRLNHFNIFCIREGPATVLSLTSFPYSFQDYVFRYGFVVGACLLALEAVMVYGADKSFSRSKITLLLSVVAAFSLGVIGVVSVKEWLLVHDGEWRRRGEEALCHSMQLTFL